MANIGKKNLITWNSIINCDFSKKSFLTPNDSIMNVIQKLIKNKNPVNSTIYKVLLVFDIYVNNYINPNLKKILKNY